MGCLTRSYPPLPYAYVFSATTGSTRLARRAGIQLATKVTAASTAIAPAYANGSPDVTPSRKPESNRVAAHAIGTPRAAPMITSVRLSRMTPRTTLVR